MPKQKLELIWIGKENRPKLESCMSNYKKGNL
jgi:hypothetical protein